MSGFPIEKHRVKFRVLSRDNLEAIHLATLEILERTGVKVYSEKILKMLDEAGCVVDFEKQSALIPSYLVNEALMKKGSVRLYARNPKYDVQLDGRHVHINTDGIGVNTLDLETGQRRPSTRDDIKKSAIIADALDDIHVYWPMVSALNIPAQIRHLHEIATSFENTEKHVQIETTTQPEEAKYIIDIAAAVAGGEDELRERPVLSSLHCSFAPLQHGGRDTEAALEFAKAGVPVAFMGMPQAGATGPVTLAGSIVVNNAEVLSALVISQLAWPGAPVIYGAGAAAFDMRTGSRAAGGPEHGLMDAALGELAKYYRMSSIVGGFSANANVPGGQACYEKIMSGLPPFLSGCDLIVGIGLIEDCATLPFEQIIIDVEIVKMIHRLAQGIEVKDETLALDVIDKVGPSGHYLSERHTREYFRKEHFIPEITDRRAYESWLKDGAKTIVDRAKESVRTILREHRPVPLGKDISQQVMTIIEKADKKLAKAETTSH